MGRGRAKAKQQKVARELKYSTHQTDLDALQRELGGSELGTAPEDDSLDDDERDSGDYDYDWARAR